jgi:hypothetical protein
MAFGSVTLSQEGTFWEKAEEKVVNNNNTTPRAIA